MDTVERLGEQFIHTLCRITRAFRCADAPFAVIGATALLLHDVELPRTTRDLDLATSISGGLEAIRPVLHDAGLLGTGVPHRFRTAQKYEIDVLPIDPDAASPTEIHLPSGDQIKAIALPEAILHAVPLTVKDCEVPVAELSLLIANKLHVGRTSERVHDLDDARAAMEQYERSGTEMSRRLLEMEVGLPAARVN